MIWVKAAEINTLLIYTKVPAKLKKKYFKSLKISKAYPENYTIFSLAIFSKRSFNENSKNLANFFQTTYNPLQSLPSVAAGDSN